MRTSHSVTCSRYRLTRVQVWQTLNMFIGEFGCVIPLLWQSQTRRRRRKALAAGYQAVPTDDGDVDGEAGGGEVEGGLNPLTGFAVCWMWFPAFFDSTPSFLLIK